MTCWRKTWQESRILSCLACKQPATPNEYKDMAWFMRKVESGMKLQICASCKNDVPETCARKLIECEDLICHNCMYTDLNNQIKKFADWQMIKCSAVGCAAVIHYNDIKDTLETQKFQEFEAKIDAEMVRLFSQFD